THWAHLPALCRNTEAWRSSAISTRTGVNRELRRLLSATPSSCPDIPTEDEGGRSHTVHKETVTRPSLQRPSHVHLNEA
ncbi:hypothetical protein JOQ06_000541, partial [Pogonophryne albipinna]